MVSLSVVFCFHGERSVILKVLWHKDFDRISAACLRHAACTMLHWNGGRTVTILFFTTAQLTSLVVVSIHMKLPPAVYLFVSLHTCRVRLCLCSSYSFFKNAFISHSIDFADWLKMPLWKPYHFYPHFNVRSRLAFRANKICFLI